MNKEKFITFILTILVAISTYAQDKLISTNSIQPREVTIIGHINKYKGEFETGSITVVDAVTRMNNQELLSIDSTGNFKTSFDLVCPTMFSYIQIGRSFFFLYLVPGETYTITINENGTHVFSGENSELNNDLYELNTAIISKFKKEQDKLNLYYQNDKNDFQSFEIFCDDLLKRKLSFVDEYCKKHEISKKATDLIKLDLKYEPAWALIGYRVVSSNTYKKRNGLSPDFYHHLYDRFQINNPEAIACKNYSNYITNIRDITLEEYFDNNNGIIEYLKKTNRFSDRELFLISKHLNKDTTITKTKEYTGFYDEHSGGITLFRSKYLTKTLLDSVSYFPSGIGRDLIISQGISFFYFQNQISPSPDEWIRMDSLIYNKNILIYLKKIDQFNQAKASKPINNNTNILPPLLKNETDKVFEKVIGKYTGKVVYIDFWATWCGPCKQEIPHSKVLSSHFAVKDVIFLDLCCQSDKKNWEAAIKAEQMIGDHYLLSTDEYNILSKLFNIQGVPTYALIDKKGNIINKNAPRPSDGPATIKAIDQLLK
jgi:thiol-disulfide isomerase/thioredoxin